MEKKREDHQGDLGWLPIEKDSIGTKTEVLEWYMPENHQFASPASFSPPENRRNSLPSSPENHPLAFTPYYPHQNTSPKGNPSFSKNTLYDPNLEDCFSRLNLGANLDPNPSFVSSNSNMGFSHRMPYADLQRMRAQSAARGQMGNFSQGQNRNYPSTLINQDWFSEAASRFTNEFLGLDNSSFSSSSLSNDNPMLHLNLFSLEELRGKIYLLAKDQDGIQYLMGKMKGGKKKEEVEMIFSEVRYRVGELMVDRMGSNFIQKFFDLCDREKITQMLHVVVSNERYLMSICCDLHGTRAMQKLLEKLIRKEQKSLVVLGLTRIAVNLAKNPNGYHVIQNCVLRFSSNDNQQLFHVIANNCVEIGMDIHGCRVLQRCLDYAAGEAGDRLVAEIAASALVLSESQYGNYVVQYMLEMKIPHVTASVLRELVGNFVSLSMNKYGSNVVERCVRTSGEDQAAQIISEIVTSPSFLAVLQDAFGNYVIQSALDIAKGRLRQTMVNLIQLHYPYLHSHPYGKRVLMKTRSGGTTRHRHM